MPTKIFLTNEVWDTKVEAKNAGGYNALVYKSLGGAGLGGGTLAISSLVEDVDSPIPDAKLTEADVDANGDVIQQVLFMTSGIIRVTLSGATSPNIKVGIR